MDKRKLYESIMSNVAKEVKKALNESRDGWEDDSNDLYELMELLGEIYNLDYELKHCVKGSYTGCNTYSELGEYIQNLGDRLIEQGQMISNLPEPEPEPEEDEEFEDDDILA